jgi:histidyl-tRNA synthetase
MEIRNFMFNKWRKVCQRYGYEEYDGPFIEPFEIYAAKSGEELVNEQLYSFEDRAKRKVAIRPEMTPTVARMVSQKFNEIPQPIRWFSIPNLWRYEKPQKGRLREHFQLNADVFGVEGVEADIEIISLLVDLLKEFGAEENMFEIRVNNRRFIDDVYKEIGISETAAKRVNKALDKKSKISPEDFEQLLLEDAKISKNEVQNLNEFLKAQRFL